MKKLPRTHIKMKIRVGKEHLRNGYPVPVNLRGFHALKQKLRVEVSNSTMASRINWLGFEDEDERTLSDT